MNVEDDFNIFNSIGGHGYFFIGTQYIFVE